MATSKGHMKHPCKGICSTMNSLIKPRDPYADDDISHTTQQYNIIDDVDDQSIAHVFCFGAFTDKISSIIYNDCTDKFPYMFLDSNVCFFVIYYYKTNAILETPIPGLDSASILDAYKKNFQYLESKGYKPKLNVMDNQATKVIKAYLNPRHAKLQLVKPHNHSGNAAERAIQTFKNQFIGALCTTDSNFPVQLWDKLAPQVQDSINLLHQSCINPNQSACKALEGPYNWNRYPMAPPGMKAIINNNADSRASWVPHGLNAWLIGPSKDHYC